MQKSIFDGMLKDLNVSQELLKYRAVNRLSQQKLAEKLGVSRPTIDALEKTPERVKPITILRALLFLESN